MRFARAAALSMVAGFVGIAPTSALAQGVGTLVVTVTSPRAGSTVSGSITVSASVTVIGSLSVRGVQFMSDGVNLGVEDTSAPYAISWDTNTAANGSHTLTAVARDALGLRWSSDPVTVTVFNDTTPPTVRITSPPSGSTVCGTVTVTADASDNVGVAGVQFLLDTSNLGAEDTSAPYSVSWNTTAASEGAHALTARVRDAAGNAITSSPVTVTVSNGGSDCVPPTVAITAPASGSTVAGTITISANAADNVGVIGVEFRIDGASGVEDTTAPYAVSWNTSGFSNGSHTLTAIARDAAGNRTTSDPVTVTVSNDSTATDCATPLPAFPGNTLFNNTVRAQMWITGNTWWSALSDNSTGIYFYKLVGGSFVKGEFIDANFAAGRPDALWNGSDLFILVQQSGSLAKLYKYGFLPGSGSFVLAAGFPVSLALAGGFANSVALDQDSTGKLWATFASGTNVYVIWSTSADHLTWDTTGFILAPDVSATTPEAATVTHFGGDKIGVLWGNQTLVEYAFRFHRDGAAETDWSAKEVVDCCSPDGKVADNHIALRPAPDGRLFAVLKDSIGSGHLHLYVRGVNGPWGQKTSVDSDPLTQATRPTLSLDVETGRAYVIYRNSTDGHTYLSSTAMNNPGFGLRCVFIDLGTNVTSTKQNVNSSTGLVAANSSAGQIFPAQIALPTATTTSTSAGAASAKAEVAASRVAPALDRTGAAAVTSAPVAGASLMSGTSVPGFESLWAGRLSTSQTPSADSQWWWLRGQGVNTLVNLDAVMYDFVQYGFESFLWMPVVAGQAPTDEGAASFLKFVQSCDNAPAHITGGAPDVRATLVALLRYAVDAWTIEAALAEGQRLNGGTLSQEQVTWLLGWAGTHPSGSEQFSSCLTL